MEEAVRWLNQARKDLSDAEYLLEGKRNNLACFVAQQAAEKALKAYLYAQGKEEVYGHSVAELSQKALRYDDRFKEVKEKGASLDKYYIPTRYPNGLPGGIPAEAFDHEDAQKAIERAEYVIEFVSNIIS